MLMNKMIPVIGKSEIIEEEKLKKMPNGKL